MDFLTIAGTVATVGTAIIAIQKIFKNIKKSREEHAEKILQEAKDAASVSNVKLEGRLDALEADLEGLKASVAKDIAYTQSSYKAALKSVEGKIADARQELRDHHAQIMQLLTALIEKE